MDFRKARLFTLDIALLEGKGKRKAFVFADDPAEAEEIACLKDSEKTLKTKEITGLHRSLTRLQAGMPREEKILTTFDKVSRLLKVNVSLDRALRLQLSGIKNGAARYILLKIIKSLAKGKGLSESFSVYNIVFSKSTLAMIKSAEESNDLSGVFFKIGNSTRKKVVFLKKLKGELIYPKLALGFGVFALNFFAFYLLPQLKEVYDSFDAELPKLTAIVSRCTDMVKENPFLLAGIVILGFLCFKKRNTVLKAEWFQEFLYKIPRLGRFLWKKDFVTTFEYLVLLLGSGIAFKEGITMVSSVTQSFRLRRILKQVRSDVIQGKSLSQAFGKVSHMMKDQGDEFVSLVAVGESSGDFEGVLGSFVSDNQEDLNDELDNFKHIINPIITVVMAIGALFVVMTFIYPMINITSIFMKQ